MSYTFVAQGRPFPKERPRSRKGMSSVYTPPKTLKAEERIASQYAGPCFDGPVKVVIQLHPTHQEVHIVPLDPELKADTLHGDIDNYMKTTLDALNGVAWVDDRQVFELHGHKPVKPT